MISYLSLVINCLLISQALGARKCRVRRSNGQGPLTGPVCSSYPCPSATEAAVTAASTFAAGEGALIFRQRFNYGSETIRGVNLGGWLVLEPWINPSMFAATGNNGIVDEYTFGAYQDPNIAQGALEQHWDTWITQSDFQAIAAAGLNHVRIPMPFWSIPTSNTTTTPYIIGSWSRLLKGVSWASLYNISVIIDIHGAPGSQNGYDNSGQRLPYPEWHKSTANVNRTLQALSTLLWEFSNTTKWGGTVGAIEALNEPASFLSDVLPVTNNYWASGYGILSDLRSARGTQSSDGTVDATEIKMAIMDGFIGAAGYQPDLSPPAAQGVLMDTHQYQLFNDDQIVLDQADHIPLACSTGAKIANYAQGNIWTYVGEWTASPTDCAPDLNGRFRPSAWISAVSGRSCDGMTGSYETFTPQFKTFLRQYFEAQVSAYELTQGWIYWAWKTETADEWSYTKGIAGGYIPADVSDPSQRRYPNICS